MRMVVEGKGNHDRRLYKAPRISVGVSEPIVSEF